MRCRGAFRPRSPGPSSARDSPATKTCSAVHQARGLLTRSAGQRPCRTLTATCGRLGGTSRPVGRARTSRRRSVHDPRSQGCPHRTYHRYHADVTCRGADRCPPLIASRTVVVLRGRSPTASTAVRSASASRRAPLAVAALARARTAALDGLGITPADGKTALTGRPTVPTEHAVDVLQPRPQPHRPDARPAPDGTLRRTDISTFVVDLTHKQLATATVVTIYRILAMILRSAVHDGLFVASPCYKIKLPGMPPRRLQAFTADEVGALLGHAPPRLRRPRPRCRHRHAPGRGVGPDAAAPAATGPRAVGRPAVPHRPRRPSGDRSRTERLQPPGPATPPVRRHRARAAHRAVRRGA